MDGQGLFASREEAGRRLAAALAGYTGRDDVVVLALPRGGVPVGVEVARALGAPLDVRVVRRLHVPGHEEVAMGAVAGGGARVVDAAVVRGFGVPAERVERVAARVEAEVERRERALRGHRPPVAVRGRTVILVDDGIATGATARAAVAALRALAPARVVVAAPVGSPAACRRLRAEADEVVCLRTPEPFWTLGVWYRRFPPATDAAARRILDGAAPEPVPA